ncbi:hypothetical protein M1N14_00155 [Dehalococcoidia bacterium]|nr:hypothetical protein [Dehalococcoidia bacterium]
MEFLQVSPDEQRVILLFKESDQDEKLKEVDHYLLNNQLEPKRKYSENRDGIDYLVYYFGHCYLADHLEILSEMASGKG